MGYSEYDGPLPFAEWWFIECQRIIRERREERATKPPIKITPPEDGWTIKVA